MIAVIYGVEGQILARMSYSTKFAKNALTHGLSVKNQLCPVRTAAAIWPSGDQDLNWSDVQESSAAGATGPPPWPTPPPARRASPPAGISRASQVKSRGPNDRRECDPSANLNARKRATHSEVEPTRYQTSVSLDITQKAKRMISTRWRGGYRIHLVLAPENDLMASVRPIFTHLYGLEAVSFIKAGNGTNGCILIWITTNPIDDIVNPAHSPLAAGARQLAKVGLQRSRI